MKTLEEMKSIVGSVTYKPGWSIIFSTDDGDRPYIQISATTPCSITGEPAFWKSGKTYLSVHMCTQELVGAVFGQIRAAEEHEMREFFRYKGASIYNPHLDPDALVAIARKAESFCLRENPMTMVESQPKVS